MPVSMEFLRGVLGILCLFFAYMTGKSFSALRKGRARLSRFYAWLLRTILCAIAIGLRHNVDTVAIGVWSLAVVLCGFGFWEAQHQKPPEDLSGQIFPHGE